MIIGSARIDERGKLSGGAAGDQKQTSANDYKGEVSMQNFYVHKLGWYVLRAKDKNIRKKLAEAMKIACNNANIGYDQNQRLGVVTKGVNSKVKTETDCSALVRACCIYAGFDPQNFTTATEVNALTRTNKFEPKKAYTNGMVLYAGDILVTKTKGHTVIVVEGMAEPKEEVTMKVKTNGGTLNIRQGAGTNYKVIGTLKNGVAVKVLSKSGEWAKIQDHNITGYCSLKYLV